MPSRDQTKRLIHVTQAEARMIKAILGKHADGFDFQINARPSHWRHNRPDLTIHAGAGEPNYRIPEIDAA